MTTQNTLIHWTLAEMYDKPFYHHLVPWGAIVESLTLEGNVRRVEPTITEYLALDKATKSEIKAGPCWWGAELINEFGHRRNASTLKNRTIAGLDIDDTGLDKDELGHRIHDLFGDVEYIIHPSISSEEYNASIRLLFPLARPCSYYVYEAMCRYLGQMIEDKLFMEFDWTSVQPERLMYMPTLCKDSEHWFIHNQPSLKTEALGELDFDYLTQNDALFAISEFDPLNPWLDPLLILHDKPNWDDPDTLPRGSTDGGDAGPKTPGIVTADARIFNTLEGAVCRYYTIEEALEISGAWQHYKGHQWSLIEGTGAAGGKVYYDDDGKGSFYSHHHSDPFGQRSLNAYQVIVGYLFGADSRDPTAHLDAFKKSKAFFMGQSGVVDQLKAGDTTYQSNITKGFSKKKTPLETLTAPAEEPSPSAKRNGAGDEPDVDEAFPDEKINFGNKIPKKGVVPPIDIPVNCEEMLTRYLFVQTGGQGLKVFDTKRKHVVDVPVATHAGHGHMGYNDAGKLVKILELDRWKESEHRITVQSAEWCPNKPMVYRDEDGIQRANMYRAVTHDKTHHNPEAVKLMIEHINWLFPIERDRKWFWQFLAHNVQHPGERIGIAPLLIAPKQGTGRGAMLQMLSGVFGSYNITNPRIEDIIEGGNNGFLFNCLLTVVDEVYAEDSRFSIQEKLNALITEKRIRLNEKWQVATDKICYTNLILLSNRPDAIPLTEGDRRIQVLENPNYFQADSYYVNLYAAINGTTDASLTRDQADIVAQANASALHDHLLTVDLSDFDRVRAWSDNKAKKNMQQMSHGGVHEVLTALIGNPPCPVMTFLQIKTWCLEYAEAEGIEFRNSALEKSIRRSGQYVKRVEGKVRVGGKKGNMQQLFVINKDSEMARTDMARLAAEYGDKLKSSGGYSKSWDDKTEGLTTKEPPCVH